MKKRILSAILCLAMLLSLCPAAFAADSSDFVIENGILTQYKGSGGSVTIPAGVTEIAPQAFSQTRAKQYITSLTIPEGCVKISAEAFYFMGEMVPSVTVTLPSTLREIGDSAFECARITQINFPEGLVSIGTDAFTQTSLKSIALPASLTSLGQDAFNNCTLLTQVTWAGHTITQAELQRCFFGTPFYYAQDAGADPDPGPGETEPTPSSDFTIENGVLTWCSAYRATSITVPEGVTAIAEGAFGQCSQVRQLVLPSTLRSIGARVFEGCELRQIDIPDGVTTIGLGAFMDCRALTQVKLPAGLTRLEDQVFQGCISLSNVTLPSGLTSIGASAFASCLQLKSINWPAALTEIGDNAFLDAGLTGAVQVPSSVKRLGSGVFNGTGITSLILPDGLESMGDSIVYDCTSLTSITFPKTGKAVEALRDKNRDAFADVMGYLNTNPSLKEINNIPNRDYAQVIADYQTKINSLGAPSQYVKAQSAAVTAKAKEITAGASSDYAKAKAIYDWVTKNIEYDYAYFRGQKATTYSSPENVLAHRLAVCGGFSNLTEALLQAAGIPAVYVSGWISDAESYSAAAWGDKHAWNMAYVDGQWILMDTTWGSANSASGQGGTYDASYFDCSVYLLAATHRIYLGSAAVAQDPEPDDPALPFTDVPKGMFFYEPVEWAVAAEITNGTSPTAFSPYETCTQAQILTFLWRASSKPILEGEVYFPVDAAYHDALVWAAGLGVIDRTSFDPGKPCARSTAVSYIWQIFGRPDAGSSGFTDVPAGADYAKAVSWAVSREITNGTSPTTFSPSDTCTRGEIVTFLYRAYH